MEPEDDEDLDHEGEDQDDEDQDELQRRDYEDRWDNPLKDEEDRIIPGNVGNSPYGEVSDSDSNAAYEDCNDSGDDEPAADEDDGDDDSDEDDSDEDDSDEDDSDEDDSD